jgi:hypothetical protein
MNIDALNGTKKDPHAAGGHANQFRLPCICSPAGQEKLGHYSTAEDRNYGMATVQASVFNLTTITT